MGLIPTFSANSFIVQRGWVSRVRKTRFLVLAIML
jgi:hypothetical protein